METITLQKDEKIVIKPSLHTTIDRYKFDFTNISNTVDGFHLGKYKITKVITKEREKNDKYNHSIHFDPVACLIEDDNGHKLRIKFKLRESDKMYKEGFRTKAHFDKYIGYCTTLTKKILGDESKNTSEFKAGDFFLKTYSYGTYKLEHNRHSSSSSSEFTLMGTDNGYYMIEDDMDEAYNYMTLASPGLRYGHISIDNGSIVFRQLSDDANNEIETSEQNGLNLMIKLLNALKIFNSLGIPYHHYLLQKVRYKIVGKDTFLKFDNLDVDTEIYGNESFSKYFHYMIPEGQEIYAPPEKKLKAPELTVIWAIGLIALYNLYLYKEQLMRLFKQSNSDIETFNAIVKMAETGGKFKELLESCEEHHNCKQMNVIRQPYNDKYLRLLQLCFKIKPEERGSYDDLLSVLKPAEESFEFNGFADDNNNNNNAKLNNGVGGLDGFGKEEEEKMNQHFNGFGDDGQFGGHCGKSHRKRTKRQSKRKTKRTTKRNIKSKSKKDKLKTLQTRKKTLEKEFKELKDYYQTGNIYSKKKEVFRHKVGRGKYHIIMIKNAKDKMEARHKIRKEYAKVSKKIKELK
jgi:hypothetical protein